MSCEQIEADNIHSLTIHFHHFYDKGDLASSRKQDSTAEKMYVRTLAIEYVCIVRTYPHFGRCKLSIIYIYVHVK